MGNAAFLQNHKIQIPNELHSSNTGGKSVNVIVNVTEQLPPLSSVFVARAGRLLARFDLSDQIRPTTAGAVRQLRGLGVELELLTGDRTESAAAVAKELGIIKVEAGVKPEGKAERIRKLRET